MFHFNLTVTTKAFYFNATCLHKYTFISTLSHSLSLSASLKRTIRLHTHSSLIHISHKSIDCTPFAFVHIPQCDQIGRFIWILGNFLKPLITINLPKSPTFSGNFCKVVKIYHFSRELILGNFYTHLAIFFWSH